MPLTSLPETRRRWNCFSQVDQLAAFDFYTSTVSLDSIQPHHLARAREALERLKGAGTVPLDDYHAIDKVMSLAVHEYTHFVDATSTLWGLRHLRQLDAGYRARGNPAGESAFPAAKELFDHVRSIRWPTYYTEKFPGGDDTLRPWSAVVTGGRVFDAKGHLTDRPIIFMNFADARSRALVRSPLSTVSVLEASAYGQELGHRFTMSNRLDAAARVVEQRELQRHTLNYIYNKQLTEYSVCAHLFANAQACKNVATAYQCATLLSRWTLNMPRAAVPRLLAPLPAVLKETEGWAPGSETTRLVQHAIAAHDIGAIFFLLVLCLPKGSGQSQADLMIGLAVALKRFGLDIEDVRAMADAEAKEAEQVLAQSPIASIRHLANAGLQNFSAISWFEWELMVPTLHLPQVVLGDVSTCHVFDNPNNALQTYDLEQAYEDLVKGQLWVESFAEACF